MVDLASASRFLAELDDSGVYTFQTFLDADAEPESAGTGPRVLHGRLDEHAEQLTEHNGRGAGIFVMVNAGDGVTKSDAKTCRTAANVLRVRALFVDLDGAPIAPVLESALPPDWVVQSSPGRWHAYWKVPNCPIGQFATAQSALACRFNGDPAVKDLPRVMRVPGFFHRKSEPFLSALYLPPQYNQLLEKPQ
jgi:hypothetical protein